MKFMWFSYLVYNLGNCAMKLCIETDLSEYYLHPQKNIIMKTVSVKLTYV
jgi:hypothetical protein